MTPLRPIAEALMSLWRVYCLDYSNVGFEMSPFESQASEEWSLLTMIEIERGLGL